jgi:hypothetical protein
MLVIEGVRRVVHAADTQGVVIVTDERLSR